MNLTINPTYTGPSNSSAVSKYNTLAGTLLTSLPIENDGGSGTALAHPEESDGTRSLSLSGGSISVPGLENELMTGWIENVHMPLSVITIGFLEDLGWSVNYSKADVFTLS